MRSADPRPLAAAVQHGPGAREFRPLEIAPVDGVLKCDPSNVPGSASGRSILIEGEAKALRGVAATAEMRNRGEIMNDAPTADPSPLDGSEIFRPHLDGGLWHWTYHDEQGRLRVRGPEELGRGAAHRGLLDTIADYCTRGEAGEEEDEPVAIEVAALHGGAGAAAPADALETCPAAMEPHLAHGDRNSA